MTRSEIRQETDEPGIHSEEWTREWIVIPDGLVEEVRMFSSYDEIEQYQADLMCRLNMPPWNGKPIHRYPDNPRVCRTYYSLAVYVRAESVQELLVFNTHCRIFPTGYPDIFTAEQAYPGSTLGFSQWLVSFAPINWSDLLMVHDCYLEYVATGQGPNWPAPTIAQNCLLDPLLKATRGMLLWEHQYDAIAREALKEFHRDVTVDDIEETKWGCEEYLNGAESERASLVKKLYVADTSFVDMVRERLLVGRPLMLNSVSLEQSRLAQILWNWRIY